MADSCELHPEGDPDWAQPLDLRPRGPAPTPTAVDADRIDRVLRGLARLRRRDPHPLSQGLSAANARHGMDLALGPLTAENLARELATPGERPPDVTVVAAYGVFTSPLEWVALYAAAGCRVRLKAPSHDPAFCEALGEDLRAEGFDVRVTTTRDLGRPTAVVAFGGDESMARIATATPGARHALHGHRFSVVLVDGELGAALAQPLAWDIAAYDTRGCMAPVAIFVLGDPDPLFAALPDALAQVQRVLPRGQVDPSLGPEWRRRLGLGRARGRVATSQDSAVIQLPSSFFTPVALPRMAVLHPVRGFDELASVLSPWSAHLSALSTDNALRPLLHRGWTRPFSWFPRFAPIGALQRPPFPRRHDGVPMLGSVCA